MKEVCTCMHVYIYMVMVVAVVVVLVLVVAMVVEVTAVEVKFSATHGYIIDDGLMHIIEKQTETHLL